MSCIFCKDSENSWKTAKKGAKNLELTEKVPIFAVSIRGIRRKDDNLYGSQSRFDPHFYEPSPIRVISLVKGF